MNSTISPVCLPDCYSYHILGNLQVKVYVDDNVYQIPINRLFRMAARKNTKRGFLFVSKILGKHIPVHPLIPVIGGAALAGRYASVMYHEKNYEQHCDFAQALVSPAVRNKTWTYIRRNPLPLPEKTLFIGFAETATALGHGMFSCFAENARYIHTTRESIVGIDDVFNFVEEHSHAMDHYCYAIDRTLFDNEDMIVLVDDEITTGKSALNFIKVIQSQYPRKKYAIVSILDWRGAADKQRLADAERELGITISCISLASGSIAVTGEPVADHQQPKQQPFYPVQSIVEKLVIDYDLGMLANFSSVNTPGKQNGIPYLYSTGRFGLNSNDQADLEYKFRQAGLFLKKKRQGKKTLCLGTGEFMHIPFKIAHYMGAGVRVQSTTRSPIYPHSQAEYGVKQAISFTSPDDHGIINYLYNIPTGYYDEVFVFLERAVDDQGLTSLLQAFAPLSIPKIVIVVCVGSSQVKEQVYASD